MAPTLEDASNLLLTCKQGYMQLFEDTYASY